MSVKFKIGFEVDAQTMFGIMAKFLPFDNLHVEEIVERPHQTSMPKLTKLPKAIMQRTAKRAPRRQGMTVNLVNGVNGYIMRALADGQPHPFSELQHIIGAAGYAPTGIGSKLTRLRELGFIVNVSTGRWRKANKEA